MAEKGKALQESSSNSGRIMEAISTLEGAITAAEQTLHNLYHASLEADKQIPIDLLRNAKGLAFFTVIKAGVIFTGRIGTGLVIAKLPDGRWSAPSAIGTAGVGFGVELGAELIEFMIILNSEEAVQSFMRRGQASAGANIEFAAGPYGRAAGASANISRHGIVPSYTYSHSKGLFGGIGLQGSAITARGDLNSKFYGREITPEELLSGIEEPPSTASDLYHAIQAALDQRPSSGNSFSENIVQSFEKIPPVVSAIVDITLVYDHILIMVKTFSDGSDAGVDFFKNKCKFYSQDELTDAQFTFYLMDCFETQQLVHLLPEMIKLLQDQKKRTSLWKLYQKLKAEVVSNTMRNNSGSSCSSGSTTTTPSLF